MITEIKMRITVVNKQITVIKNNKIIPVILSNLRNQELRIKYIMLGMLGNKR